MANGRTALTLIASLVATLVAASCTAVEPHGDPACAFDGSACQAVALVFAIVPDSNGQQATLSAGAGVPQNSWSMSGVPVAPGDPTPALPAKPTARSIRVSQEASISGSLELKIEKPDGTVASTVQLTATEQSVELEAGTYALRLSPGTTTSTGAFAFAICAGGC